VARYRPAHTPHGGARHRAGGLRSWLTTGVAVAVLGAASVGMIRVDYHHSARRPQRARSGEEKEKVATAAGKVVASVVGPRGITSAWVKAENAKPGTAAWRLAKSAQNGEIEGYADHVSTEPGQPASLYVSTGAPTFHVEAYRLGYYQGLGGRMIWKSQELPGVRQAKPTVSDGANMVEARWRPSLAISSNAGWPEGDYVLKLVASTGWQQYVPLTVRNGDSTATYLMMNAVTTWQAYNLWGGYDLYEGVSGSGSDFVHRSRVVSFDRPYKYGAGAADFLTLEYPLVSLAESLGLDVTYVTSVDVDEHPALLQRHRAVLSPGHDEYYSANMRQGLIAARDRGVNLAFMGANAIFRHVRFAASKTGQDRLEICYKSAREDPLTGRDNADVTVDWRDAPTNMPESTITGDLYQCNPVKADMVVIAASDWVFSGTGLRNGEHLAGVVGSEYDRYDPAYPHPPNVDILTHSPLSCGGHFDYSDATYYSAASGAGVFASGTIGWIPDLQAGCGSRRCPGPDLIRITQNLLAAFGVGPAGEAHPTAPNLAKG
jgi:hypothetical protein